MNHPTGDPLDPATHVGTELNATAVIGEQLGQGEELPVLAPAADEVERLDADDIRPGTMFDPPLTYYADGTPVVMEVLGELRRGLAAGRVDAQPYPWQRVLWADNTETNVAPHVLQRDDAADPPAADTGTGRHQEQEQTQPIGEPAPEPQPGPQPAAPPTGGRMPCSCAGVEVVDPTTGEVVATTGCERTTSRMFAPGHDAKLKSLLIRAGARGFRVRLVGSTQLRMPTTLAARYGFAEQVERGIRARKR